MNRKELALCVLAKYPTNGNVKTRLAKKIGSRRAVLLYSQLLQNVVAQVKRADIPRDFFIISSDTRHGRLLKSFFLDHTPIIFYTGESLNVLLQKTFHDFLVKRKYKKVIVTCSDSPFVTTELVSIARHILDQANTLFISPASDGGYSLIGLNKYVDLFSNMTMSTNNVLESTLALAASAGLNIHSSGIVNDIDIVEDVYTALVTLNDASDPGGFIGRYLKNAVGIIKKV